MQPRRPVLRRPRKIRAKVILHTGREIEGSLNRARIWAKQRGGRGAHSACPRAVPRTGPVTLPTTQGNGYAYRAPSPYFFTNDLPCNACMSDFKFEMANGQRPYAESSRVAPKPVAKQPGEKGRRAEHAFDQDGSVHGGGPSGSGNDGDSAASVSL